MRDSVFIHVFFWLVCNEKNVKRMYVSVRTYCHVSCDECACVRNMERVKLQC